MTRLLGYLAVYGLRLVDLADDFGDWMISAGEAIKGRTAQLRMSLDAHATLVDRKALCDECGDRVPISRMVERDDLAMFFCRICDDLESIARATRTVARERAAQSDEGPADE